MSGVLAFLFWSVSFVTWVVFVVAMWRAMKAHEAIAARLEKVINLLELKEKG